MAERELDVLVVGGGVVGAGTALDAATRGLATGIVEARDWASGTSSRSSKLIHGGLRYLEMLDFALVREALKERGLLLERIAPHLVKPVPFLYPLQHKGLGAAVRGLGRRDVRRHVALLRARARACRTTVTSPAVTRCASHPAEEGRARRRPPVLRRADGRRAVRRHPGPHRRRVRGAGRQPGPGRGFLREGERVVGARVQDLEQGGELRGARPSGRQRDRGVDRRHPGADRRARPVPRTRLQGHPSGRAQGPHPLLDRADPAHREERPVRHPVGPSLDHRAPPTPTGTSTRPTRPPPAPTSTICSTTSTPCWPCR